MSRYPCPFAIAHSADMEKRRLGGERLECCRHPSLNLAGLVGRLRGHHGQPTRLDLGIREALLGLATEASGVRVELDEVASAVVGGQILEAVGRVAVEDGRRRGVAVVRVAVLRVDDVEQGGERVVPPRAVGLLGRMDLWYAGSAVATLATGFLRAGLGAKGGLSTDFSGQVDPRLVADDPSGDLAVLAAPEGGAVTVRLMRRKPCNASRIAASRVKLRTIGPIPFWQAWCLRAARVAGCPRLPAPARPCPCPAGPAFSCDPPSSPACWWWPVPRSGPTWC